MPQLADKEVLTILTTFKATSKLIKKLIELWWTRISLLFPSHHKNLSLTFLISMKRNFTWDKRLLARNMISSQAKTMKQVFWMLKLCQTSRSSLIYSHTSCITTEFSKLIHKICMNSNTHTLLLRQMIKTKPNLSYLHILKQIAWI